MKNCNTVQYVMLIPRGPGSGAVEVGMRGDLDVQVKGGAAALIIQTKH